MTGLERDRLDTRVRNQMGRTLGATFGELLSELEMKAKDYRHLDRSLVRLKKQSLIRFDRSRGGWVIA